MILVLTQSQVKAPYNFSTGLDHDAIDVGEPALTYTLMANETCSMYSSECLTGHSVRQEDLRAMHASILVHLESQHAGSVQQLKLNDCLRCLSHTSPADHSFITTLQTD